MTTIVADITETLRSYFDVLYHGDLNAFDRVFADSCVLQAVRDGEHFRMPIAEYRTVLANRASPASQNAVRDDVIHHIDIVSETAACAKVGARVGTPAFVDYLGLLKIGGQWRIVAKVFHQVA